MLQILKPMFQKLLSIFYDKTFLRFVIVGVINTIFGATIMFVAYNVFHFGYWFSTFANYFLGSILSYFLNKYYTFKYKQRNLAVVVRFTLNIAICWLIAYGISKPLMMWILSSCAKNIQENVAMLVGMCLFVGLNYIGQRFFAFKKEEVK